jgi:hypothetical protein
MPRKRVIKSERIFAWKDNTITYLKKDNTVKTIKGTIVKS